MARRKSKPTVDYQTFSFHNDSCEHFRHFLDVFPDAAVITQNDGTILIINKQMEKLLGYKREELVGQSVEILIPERFRNRHVKKREAYTLKPSIRPMGSGLTLYALHKNGTEIPVDINLSPFDTDEGLFIISSIRDITTQKEVEKSLLDRKLKLKKAQRIAKIGFLDWNLKTNEINWSDEIFCLFGIEKTDKKQTIDTTVALVHPDDKAFVKESLDQAILGVKEYDIEHRIQRPDGKVIWVHARAELTYDADGNPDSLLGTVIDITERKKMEKIIKESEERYRGLSEAAFEAIFISEKGVCLEQNSTAEKMFGYTLSEAIGRKGTEWIAAEDREMVMNNMLSSYEEPYEAVALRKDGSTFPAQIQGRMTHYKGRAVRVTALSDITARKQMEKELMNSREEMQSLAGKLLTAQEEERRLLARELHDDLTQRLALMAIEIGKLESQSKSLSTSFSQGISKIREDIINISEDVHDISRQLHPSILDDLGLVDALKSECAIFSQHEGLPVKYAPQNVHKKIPRDIALCIYRIAQHSLKNIVKHAKATEVSVSVTCDDNTIYLKVEDNGIGFIPKQVKGKGGLGLVSMKERVRLIQGNLSIQSKPGKGTVIKVEANLDQSKYG